MYTQLLVAVAIGAELGYASPVSHLIARDAESDICDDPQGFSVDNWRNHHIGEWIVNMCASYQDGGFDFGDMGLPETFAAYNGMSKDTDQSWVWNCEGPENSCAVDGIDDPAKCKLNYYRDFGLYSMQNFANYLSAFYEWNQDNFINLGLKSGSFVDTYTSAGESDDIFTSGSSITVLSGILGTFASFASPLQAGFAGASGVLGATSGLMSALGANEPTSAGEDLFKTWAEFTDKLGDVQKSANSAIVDYYNKMLNEPPPENWTDDDSSLPKLLEAGVFASSDVLNSKDTDSSKKTAMLMAPVISLLWQHEGIFLAKVSDGHFHYDDGNDGGDFDYHPCDGQGNWHQGMNLDDQKICIDDHTAYMPMRWNSDKDDTWTIPGLSSLPDDAAVSLEDVVRSSIQTQSTASDWFSSDKTLFWKDLINDPSLDSFETYQLAQYSLPICDLDQMDMDEWYGCKDHSFNTWDKCFYYTVQDYCSGGMKLGGNDWPWDEYWTGVPS